MESVGQKLVDSRNDISNGNGDVIDATASVLYNSNDFKV